MWTKRTGSPTSSPGVGSSNGGIHPIRANATGTVRILFVDQEPDIGWHAGTRDKSAVYRFWKSGESARGVQDLLDIQMAMSGPSERALILKPMS